MKNVIPFKSFRSGNSGKNKHFDAFWRIHSQAVSFLREAFSSRTHTEVNSKALRDLVHFPRTALPTLELPNSSILQTCQLQLEALVVKLGGSFFTVNDMLSSYENQTKTNRFTRFFRCTAFEIQRSFRNICTQSAFDKIMYEIEENIKYVTRNLLENNHADLYGLGCDLNYLKRVMRRPFIRISYQDALKLLTDEGGREYVYGDRIGPKEERRLLQYFCNLPIFIIYSPTSLRSFNLMKTEEGNYSRSIDLILPKLGRSAIGGLVEPDIGKVQRNFLEMHTYNQEYLIRRNQLKEYFKNIEAHPPMLRGGYSLSLERYLDFLYGSRLF